MVYEDFEANRAMLLGLAYRILGSKSDAEDIVHEVFIKWSEADLSKVVHIKAWLAKVTTNLSLDVLKSAQRKREEYFGPWLPEPYVTEDENFEKALELDETISVALMMMLEKLNPAQRVAFILHDIFNFSFDEIASMVNASPQACRKQASRARQKIDQDNIRQRVSRKEHEGIATAFLGAVRNGDLQTLCSLLTNDVVLYSDGGGKVQAASKPICGKEKVTQFLNEIVLPSFVAANQSMVTTEVIMFNGSPGLVVKYDHEIVTAFQFSIREMSIEHIYAYRNPDKLEQFRPLQL